MRSAPIIVALTIGVAGGGAAGYHLLTAPEPAAQVQAMSAPAVPAPQVLQRGASPSSATPTPSGSKSAAPHPAAQKHTRPAHPASGRRPAPATGGGVRTPSGTSGGKGGLRPRCTSSVTPSGDLAAAVARLGAGKTLCLAPGTYTIPDRVRVTSQMSGSPGSPAVIAARDGLGSVTVNGNGAEEAFYVAGAHDVVIQGLRITGGAWHGVKIDAPSTRITVRGNAIFDNIRAGDDEQYSAIKGCCLASRVMIEGNDIYNTRPGPGSNQQGIDCNSCAAWVVRGNRVHGIRSQGENGNAIQFKSGSTDTVIEKNIVYDNFLGISYGGWGNPAWGHQSYESVGGVVRDNIVFGNTDAGISVLLSKDGKVIHNTLWNNGFAPDVRRGAVNLQYQDNILDRPLLLRDGTTARAGGNYVLPSPSSARVFVDARGHDFRLKPGSPAAGRGARRP